MAKQNSSGKGKSINPVVLTLIMAAFGVLLVIKSDLGLELVVRILGACLIVGGVVNFFTFSKNKEENNAYVKLFIGILAVAAGILLEVKPDWVVTVFPIVIGVFIILNGILNLVKAMDLKKKQYGAGWKLPLILSFISMGFGLFIIFFHFDSDPVKLRIVGIAMIYDAVTSLWIHTRKPKAPQAPVQSAPVQPESSNQQNKA